jgi:decaprenylphospho-beta-D-ribofuranose 2-oxidase
MQPLVRPETTDTPRAVKSERSVPPPSTIRGWGRLGARGRELRSDDLERATVGATLSRGLGRSYGDASLPAADRPRALNTTLADRILGFDEQTGVLHAEAGLSLEEMNRLFLPRRGSPPSPPAPST